jgi:hypothetical protein
MRSADIFRSKKAIVESSLVQHGVEAVDRDLVRKMCDVADGSDGGRVTISECVRRNFGDKVARGNPCDKISFHHG